MAKVKCEYDCFDCPFDDCIAGLDGKISSRSVKKHTKSTEEEINEAKRKNREAQKRFREKNKGYFAQYYRDHREELNAIRRAKRSKAREGISEMVDFGEWLRFARKEKGLTQTDLGTLLSMDANAVSSFELNKRSPTFSTLNYIVGKMGYELFIVPKE